MVKKKDAAPKKDTGGDDQLVFFFIWPYRGNNINNKRCLHQHIFECQFCPGFVTAKCFQ